VYFAHDFKKCEMIIWCTAIQWWSSINQSINQSIFIASQKYSDTMDKSKAR